MQFLKRLFDKNAPYLFFIKFLLCFFILYYFFPFYQGLTAEGGRFYSSFLDAHLNLVKGFTSFLTGVAKLVLDFLGYHANQRNYHTLIIPYSRGISVNPSCLGWGVMSFWVAFVFANAATWVRKMKWMIGGLSAIILLNISRIVLIVVANHLHWKTFTSLDPHATFNICSYGCIFLLMFWFTRVQKKYEISEVKQTAGQPLRSAMAQDMRFQSNNLHLNK